MTAVTDLHTHVLPGLDDGSGSPEESLQMLRLSGEQGIRLLAATPHFDPVTGELQRFLDRRARAAEALARGLEPGMPRILLGAEVRYFRGISEFDSLERLTLEGGKALLLELPPAPWPESLWQELALFRQRQGILPIIAHVDRYLGPWGTRRIPERLAELPALIQANSSFFLKRTTASLARRLLAAGRIHLLGSDCHGTDHRAPNLGPALERIAPWAEEIRRHERTILPSWAEELYQ